MMAKITDYAVGQEFGGPDMRGRVVAVVAEDDSLQFEVLEAPGFTWGMLPGRTYTLLLSLFGYFQVMKESPDFVVHLLGETIEFRHRHQVSV